MPVLKRSEYERNGRREVNHGIPCAAFEFASCPSTPCTRPSIGHPSIHSPPYRITTHASPSQTTRGPPASVASRRLPWKGGGLQAATTSPTVNVNGTHRPILHPITATTTPLQPPEQRASNRAAGAEGMEGFAFKRDAGLSWAQSGVTVRGSIEGVVAIGDSRHHRPPSSPLWPTTVYIRTSNRKTTALFGWHI